MQPCHAFPEWHGINPPTLLDAAYQASIATRALTFMSFEEAQRYARIYAAQRQLEKIHDVDGSGFLLSTNPKKKSFCVSIIREISRLDQQWLNACTAMMHAGQIAVP